LSIDLSKSAIESVSRFNPNSQRANVMAIPEEHPEWIGKFDFANLWGVAMHTHDPLKAFLSAASTVTPGGALYLMVYCPKGPHGSLETLIQRRRFHQMQTVEERLAYIDQVYERRWDWSLPLRVNLQNTRANIRGWPRSTRMGILDLLQPYYNWVIPLDIVYGWMARAGFVRMTPLNEREPDKCGYHVLGIRDGGDQLVANRRTDGAY
jgi:hypothetical protein